MTRKRRVWEPHKCHHVMLRGIDGRRIFEDSDDKVRFCLLLQESSEVHSQRIHAFCLMDNHIHLMVEPIKGSLQEGVRRFAFRYAQYFNKRHNRRGYVFQGRFRSILIEDGAYLRRVVRYIHLNPVEAGLVTEPEDYVWSSYQAYLGDTFFTWLETDRVLSRFGENRSDAFAYFVEFMRMKLEAKVDCQDLKDAIRIGVYGPEEFVRKYVTELEDTQQRPLANLSIEQLIERICDHLNVSFEQLCGSGKSKKIVDGRSVLAYACQYLKGGSLGNVCRVLNKHHGTLSRLAVRVNKSQELMTLAERILQV